MTLEQIKILRENLAKCAAQHRKMIVRAEWLEMAGYTLLGLGQGYVLSFAVDHYYMHRPFYWFYWILIISALATGWFIPIVILVYLHKRKKFHKTAADAMEGVLNSPPKSNLRYHYMEQGSKALDDIIELDKQFNRIRWLVSWIRKKKVELQHEQSK
jgi:hypothetical protein